MRARIAFLCVIVLSAWFGTSALAQTGPESMPKGGKALLLQVLGSPPDVAELKRIAAGTHSSAEWGRLLAARTRALSKPERRTLADYLAVNMPLKPEALEQALKGGNAAAALPPDGRDLASNRCLGSCHSEFLFKLHKKSFDQWVAVATAAYHKLVKLDAKQTETFARYAEVNMPTH